jgi:26S proteasome regulatory subunit N13
VKLKFWEGILLRFYRHTVGNAETQAAVANFLKSLQGGSLGQQQGLTQSSFTTLPDLLQTSTTVPTLAAASDEHLDDLLSHLPPTILLLASGQSPEDIRAGEADPDPETLQAIAMSLEPEKKRKILEKVLRSPQFSQSLGSLTMAIRDGGLPTIAEALGVKLANGGFVKGGSVPLGGGDAVEAFLEGIKAQVHAEDEETMETD